MYVFTAEPEQFYQAKIGPFNWSKPFMPEFFINSLPEQSIID